MKKNRVQRKNSSRNFFSLEGKKEATMSLQNFLLQLSQLSRQRLGFDIEVVAMIRARCC